MTLQNPSLPYIIFLHHYECHETNILVLAEDSLPLLAAPLSNTRCFEEPIKSVIRLHSHGPESQSTWEILCVSAVRENAFHETTLDSTLAGTFPLSRSGEVD